MKSFGYFFDGFLSKTVLFIVGIVLGGYYCKSSINTLLFATVFSLCLGEIYLHFLGKKTKVSRSAKENAILDKLAYSPQSELRNILLNALSSRGITFQSGVLSIGDCAIFCAVKPCATTVDEVYDYANLAVENGFSKVVIIANRFSPDATEFCKKWSACKVLTVDGDGVLELLTRLDALPQVETISRKQRYSTLLRSAICPDRVKSYFSSAFVMLILSAFVTRSVYFLIFGALSLSLGIVSLFVNRKKV